MNNYLSIDELKIKIKEIKSLQFKDEIEKRLIYEFCPNCYWGLKHGCHIDIVGLEYCASRHVVENILKEEMKEIK